MSAEQNNAAEVVKLDGVYAHKMGMSTVYDDNGEAVPVTVLRMEPWVVSQVKTSDRDGYVAVQISSRSRPAQRTTAGEKGHFKGAGFENGAYFCAEIRQKKADDVKAGQKVSIESLQKGDVVNVTSKSKGRGFAGSVKRFGFGGGPAAHGSKFHRQPGSSGNRTWPGRVMPGKRFPGHYGFANTTVRGLRVVDVIPEENVILVKGAVPGAQNTLVRLMKTK